MKKIVFVIDSLSVGGLQKVNVMIANRLSQEYEVNFYEFERSTPFYDTKVPIAHPEYQMNCVKYFFVRVYKKLVTFMHCQVNPVILNRVKIDLLIQYLKKNDIDCVVLNSGNISFAKQIKQELPEINIVGWIHTSVGVYLNQYFKWMKDYFIEGMENCDYLICLTREDKEDLKDILKNSITVKVIHNPIGARQCKVSSLHEKKIVFAGRIDYRGKGIDYLIELAKTLPDDWSIDIVGSGKKKEIRKLKKDILKFKLTNKLYYLGVLTENEMNDFFSKGSIFISTSRWEGFGLVIVEAMQAGLPIVSFDHRGAKEILGQTYGRIVPSFDMEKMEKEVSMLIDDFSIRVKYQNKSLNRVKDFSLESIINEWKKIL